MTCENLNTHKKEGDSTIVASTCREDVGCYLQVYGQISIVISEQDIKLFLRHKSLDKINIPRNTDAVWDRNWFGGWPMTT